MTCGCNTLQISISPLPFSALYLSFFPLALCQYPSPVVSYFSYVHLESSSCQTTLMPTCYNCKVQESFIPAFTHYLAKHPHLQPTSTISAPDFYQPWPKFALASPPTTLLPLSQHTLIGNLLSATFGRMSVARSYFLDKFVRSDHWEVCGDGGASFGWRQSHANTDCSSATFDWELSSQSQSSHYQWHLPELSSPHTFQPAASPTLGHVHRREAGTPTGCSGVAQKDQTTWPTRSPNFQTNRRRV